MFTAVSAKTEKKVAAGQHPAGQHAFPPGGPAPHKGMTGAVWQSATSSALLGTLTLLVPS